MYVPILHNVYNMLKIDSSLIHTHNFIICTFILTVEYVYIFISLFIIISFKFKVHNNE